MEKFRLYTLNIVFILNAMIVVFTTSCKIEMGRSETINPEIIEKSPGENAPEVPVNSIITARFSESVVGVNNSNKVFTLKKIGAVNNVVAAVNYNDSTHTISLTPDSLLDADSYYIVTISNDIQDRAGNVLRGSPVIWIFTTGGELDLTAPEILTKAPYAGEQNVATDTNIVVEFSEPVVAVDDTTFTLELTNGGTLISGVVNYENMIATFDPDTTLTEGVDYTVRITGGTDSIRDIAGNPITSTFWVYKTEDTVPPSIVNRYPDDGSTEIPRNANITIQFNEFVYNANNASIQLTQGGGQISGTIVYASTTYEATFTPLVELESLTTYTITIKGGSDNYIKDFYGNLFAEDETWDFTTSNTSDETPPIIVLKNPDSNDIQVPVSTTIQVEFNESVTGVTPSSFLLTNLDIDTQVTVPAENIIFNEDTLTATLTPPTNLDEGTFYRVELTNAIIDGAENKLTIANIAWSFKTIDTTAPTVSTRSPSNGETGRPRNVNITVQFSEPVTGVDNTTFTLEDATGDVAVVVDYDRTTNTARMAPEEYLGNNVEYTVYLKTGITDISASNNPLTPESWSFTTRSDLDETPPGIDSKTPEGSVPPADLGTDIVAVFSENVNNVNNGTFTLEERDSGTPISGFVTYDILTLTATFVTDNDLSSSMWYTATLTSDIADTAGLALGETVWDFQTDTDNKAPEIRSTLPKDGATRVSIGAEITVFFSEPVTGVDGTTFTLEDVGTGIEVPAVVTYDATNDSATLDPNDFLIRGHVDTPYEYKIIIKTGILDLFENGIEKENGDPPPIEFTFTTEPDETPPNIVLISREPYDLGGNPALASVSSNVIVNFTEEMLQSSFTNSTFYLSPTAGGPDVTGTHDFNAASYLLTFNPSSDLGPDTEYEVIIDGVTDLVGNSYTMPADEWTFTTGQIDDIISPDVYLELPSDLTSVNQPLDLSSITISFSEDVFFADSSTITIKEGVSTLSADVTYNSTNDQYIITPEYNFGTDTDYTVNFSTMITDTSGNQLNESPWTFHTETSDGIAPTYVSRYPDVNDDYIPLKPVITVVFTESVTGVTKDSFTLDSPGDYDVYYDDSTYTATLLPRDNLVNDNDYIVEFTDAVDQIEDQSGNPLANDSWTFRTDFAPTIIDADPTDDETGVSISQNQLQIDFSVPMDPEFGTLEFTGGQGYLENRTWSNGDQTLTYDIIGPLSESTTYTLTFNSWWEPFKDTEGNELDVSNIGSTLVFTTGSDSTGPSIISRFPKDGSTTVGTNVPYIIVRFNEPMNPAGTASESGDDITFDGGTWFKDNKAVLFNITGGLPLSTSTTYDITLTGFTDTDSPANDLTDDTFSFETLGSATTQGVILTEDFESSSYDYYTNPHFDTFLNNEASDDHNWSQAAVSKTPNASPPEGSYMALANTLSWSIDKSAYLDQDMTSDFSSPGTYILSFKMAHDSECSANDRISIRVSTGDTFTQVGPAIYRYVNNIPALWDDDFETNKDWILNGTGEWERGAPLGGGAGDGNPNPGSAYSGTNVLGTDLNGTYSNGLGATYWATSTTIDLSNAIDVTFEFQRWLNIESNDYDHTYIEVYDGSGWQQIWENPSSDLFDTAWNLSSFDISAYAAGNSNFQIRYGIGTTDGSVRSSGWNIDSIRLYSKWQTHYIDLSSYSGSPSVTVRFEAISGGETGNNILIDDVSVTRY